MDWLRHGAKRAAGCASSVAAREALVHKLVQDGHITSPNVADAFRVVPREIFVPDIPLGDVYRSSDAIVTKRVDGVGVSSASAPDVVAIMLEQMDLRPGQRVMEVGAGTGYNAALLAELVGSTGHVVTVDIDEDLVLSAREHLARAGYQRVEVVQGDGALGLPSRAPFDRIILTAASNDIAPAWRDQLARPAGRIVLPLSLRGSQRTVAFAQANAHLVSISSRACSFIPLRGRLASSSRRLSLGPTGGIVAGLHDDTATWEVAAGFGARMYDRLAGPYRDWPTRVPAGARDLGEGFGLWLALRERNACSLWADATVPEARQLVPPLFSIPGRWHATLGLVDEDGLVLLARSEIGAGPGKHQEGRPSEIMVRGFGADQALAERLRGHLTEWHAVGRPGDEALRIRAYPAKSAVEAAAGQAVVDTPSTRLVVDWLGGSQPPASLTT